MFLLNDLYCFGVLKPPPPKKKKKKKHGKKAASTTTGAWGRGEGGVLEKAYRQMWDFGGWFINWTEIRLLTKKLMLRC